MSRTLIACVGNLLRGDDGFGVAVAQHLSDLPADVDVIETGIGGMSIVQQLMSGYDALIVVDALDRGAAPGTLFVFEPDVPDPRALGVDHWCATFSNLHLAEPSRVLLLARAAGALPRRVAIVGCQIAACDDFAPELTPHVAAAVPLAAQRVRELIAMGVTV